MAPEPKGEAQEPPTDPALMEEARKIQAEVFEADDQKQYGRITRLAMRMRQILPKKYFSNYWLGVVSFREDRCPDAVPELTEYLAKRKISLDAMSGPRKPDDTALDVISMIEKCDKRGGVEIRTNPPGARIRVDDEKAPPAGPTPIHSRYLRTGAHRVFIDLDGYKPARKTVVVRRSEVTLITVNLEPILVAGVPHGNPVKAAESSKPPAGIGPEVAAAKQPAPAARKRPGLDEDEDETNEPTFRPPPPPVPSPAVTVTKSAVLAPPVMIPALSPEKPRWYQKPWVWGVISGCALLVGGGIAGGTYIATRPNWDDGADFLYRGPMGN